MEIVEAIQKKWHAQTSETKGYFIRFKDGNSLNCQRSNLEHIHPYDAFVNPSYKVDWDLSLTEREKNFVKNNMPNFAVLYAERINAE